MFPDKAVFAEKVLRFLRLGCESSFRKFCVFIRQSVWTSFRCVEYAQKNAKLCKITVYGHQFFVAIIVTSKRVHRILFFM